MNAPCILGAVSACIECEDGDGYVITIPGGAWGLSSRQLAIGEPVRIVDGTAVRDRPRDTLSSVLAEVAERYGVPVPTLLGPAKDKKTADIRHEAIWEIRRRTTLSLPAIGKRFARDHTTILNSVRRHTKRMAETQA